MEAYVLGMQLPANSTQTKKLTNKIGRMLALDFLPYSLVEGRGYREPMVVAEPRFVVSCRTTFFRKIIPNLYTECSKIDFSKTCGRMYLRSTCV